MVKAAHLYCAAALLLLSCVVVGSRPLSGCTAMTKEHGRRPLHLRGRVGGVRLARETASSIVFDVKLYLEFTNAGDRPAIILRREFWLGAKTLARSPEDAAADKYLYTSSHWPSLTASPEWETLRQRLNEQFPPPDVTRVLAPGESLPYEAKVTLYIQKAGSFDGTSQKWEAIRQASPVWLQVTFEMWPIALEPRFDPDNPDFGKTLRRRWHPYGRLEIEHLTSEPMQLDLTTLALGSAAR